MRPPNDVPKKARYGTAQKGQRKAMPPGRGDLPEEAIADLLPPQARIYKDLRDKRYRVYYANGASMSRSWVLRLPREAILDVLHFACEEHEDETGEKCYVKGVF